MKESIYKSYDELPLMLNADTLAKVMGISPSTAYELMHEKGFPTLKIGNRLVVPKQPFIDWVTVHNVAVETSINSQLTALTCNYALQKRPVRQKVRGEVLMVHRTHAKGFHDPIRTPPAVLLCPQLLNPAGAPEKICSLFHSFLQNIPYLD
jgi:predicted DNA-binding transcriptional regulator AlpA